MSDERRKFVKDVDQTELVKQIALFLKKSGKVQLPPDHDVVKLGRAKQRAPNNPDWYILRVAAIARRMYYHWLTVKHLRVDFGTKKNRGVAPEHFVAEGAAFIKAALKTLDAIGWSKLNANGKGRIITEEGKKDLDRIARTVLSNHTEELF